MIRTTIMLSLLCILSAPALASEADFEKRMARGVAALGEGNAVLAREEFSEALKEKPADPDASLYLAIALNRAGDPAAEPALKNVLRREPGNPRINFELGTLYYNRTMLEEAADYFESMQRQTPDQEMKAAAETYLADIRRRSSGKRWGVTLMGGMQYDTNVPLANSESILPAAIERRSDWRKTFHLGMTGVAYRDSVQELSAGYSLYLTLHDRLDEFNLTQNLFDVGYKRQISSALLAKISGGIELVYLGGHRFVSSYSVTPGLLVALRQGMRTELDLRYRNSTFNNSSIFPTNTERNGVTYSSIFNHRQRLSDLFTIRLGYILDRDRADFDYWSSISNTASTGLAVSMTKTVIFDISAEAMRRKYDEIMAGAAEKRSDTTLIGAATLTWQAFEMAGISVGYHHTANYSNIPGYDFTRGVTSVLLQGRY